MWFAGKVAKIPSRVKQTTWYRRATIKERALVAQSIENLKAQGYSDAGIARLQPSYFEKLIKERQVTEFGKVERIISEEAFTEAKARFDSKLTEARTGIDPEMVKDLNTMGAYYIESGFKKFADFSKKMIDEHGKTVDLKPHLKDIWTNALLMAKVELPAEEPITVERRKEPELREQIAKEIKEMEEAKAKGESFESQVDKLPEERKAFIGSLQRQIDKAIERGKRDTQAEDTLNSYRRIFGEDVIDSVLKAELPKRELKELGAEKQLREAEKELDESIKIEKIEPIKEADIDKIGTTAHQEVMEILEPYRKLSKAVDEQIALATKAYKAGDKAGVAREKAKLKQTIENIRQQAQDRIDRIKTDKQILRRRRQKLRSIRDTLGLTDADIGDALNDAAAAA